jgi:hypothetical protein
VVGMPAKKNPISEAERSRRFIEKARELGADEPTEAFERVVRRVAGAPKKPKDEPKKD